MFNKPTIHCAEDARHLARKTLPWMVFDYIDGAAGNGVGEANNRQLLEGLQLIPRVLVNVEQRSLRTTLFERECERPFGITPMGMCNLSAVNADLMLAKLAAANAVPVGVSTVASTPLEKMIEVAQGHAWFQFYFSGDGSVVHALIDRAKVAGYETLVITVDVPEVGRRPRELRRGFTMPFKIGPKQFIDFACHPYWSLSQLFNGRPELANFGGEYGEFDRTESRARADIGELRRIRDLWPGKLVVKGVVSVDDARWLMAEGIDAIQVSSHGGRQLNGGVSPIRALHDIRQAVGAEFPLFYDSGIRGGEDVVKAYALGANFVFLGRPLLFAMAANGATGLQQYWQSLSEETSITLAQVGVRDMASVNANMLNQGASEVGVFNQSG